MIAKRLWALFCFLLPLHLCAVCRLDWLWLLIYFFFSFACLSFVTIHRRKEKHPIWTNKIECEKKLYALHKYSSIFPYSSSISNTPQYALVHTHRLPRKQHNVLDTPNTLTHCTQNSKHTDIIVAAVGGWYWRLSIYTLYYTNALDSIAAMNN